MAELLERRAGCPMPQIATPTPQRSVEPNEKGVQASASGDQGTQVADISGGQPPESVARCPAELRLPRVQGRQGMFVLVLS